MSPAFCDDWQLYTVDDPYKTHLRKAPPSPSDSGFSRSSHGLDEEHEWKAAILGEMGEFLHTQLTHVYSEELLLKLTKDDVLGGHLRRFGARNPEAIGSIPYYKAMVQCGLRPDGPYGAFDRLQQHDPNMPCCPRPRPGNALWTWGHRDGRSQTRLPDGRIFEIGGSYQRYGEKGRDIVHCVFNDVGVTRPERPRSEKHRNTFGYTPPEALAEKQEERFTLYGYPCEAFPPAAYHTATVIGEFIYIAGGRAAGSLSIHRLNTTTLAFEEVAFAGTKPVGLLHHATTVLADGNLDIRGGSVAVPSAKGSGQWERQSNADVYALDMQTMEMRKCTV